MFCKVKKMTCPKDYKSSTCHVFYSVMHGWILPISVVVSISDLVKSELTLVAYLVASACAAASWMSLTRLLYLKTVITITSLNEDMIFAALCLMGLWQQNVYKMCTPLFSGKHAYFTSCGDLWQKQYLHTYCRTVTKIQVETENLCTTGICTMHAFFCKRN